MAKDFYTILGVKRDADEKEIKRAYRKLARQYHPDINPNDKAAEAKFKEINEAYQVLSDEEKRSRYDQFGESFDKIPPGYNGPPPGANGPGQGGFPDFGGFTQADLEEILRQQSGRAANPRSDGFSTETGDIGGLFGEFFGGKTRMRGKRGPQPGQDIEQPVEISLGESIRGAQRRFTFQVADPNAPRDDRRDITVKIPAGVRDGARVRVAGKGASGTGGGPNGDLFLLIRVLPHPFWTREGDDLKCEVPISTTEAALGATIEVPTINGHVSLKIPPGTQSGQNFRLSGRGVSRRDGTSGDEFVRVKVTVPKNLSPREEELWRELAALRAENVRAGLKADV